MVLARSKNTSSTRSKRDQLVKFVHRMCVSGVVRQLQGEGQLRLNCSAKRYERRRKTKDGGRMLSSSVLRPVYRMFTSVWCDSLHEVLRVLRVSSRANYFVGGFSATSRTRWNSASNALA